MSSESNGIMLTMGQCDAIDKYLDNMKRWASKSEFMAPDKGVDMLDMSRFVNQVDRITPHAMLAMLSSDREGVLTSDKPMESIYFSMFYRCMELRRYASKLGEILAKETIV